MGKDTDINVGWFIHRLAATMLSLICIVILINSPVSTFYSPFVLFICDYVLIVVATTAASKFLLLLVTT